MKLGPQIGLLPALGNNLDTLRAHGQIARFHRHCLWYDGTFNHKLYFPYASTDYVLQALLLPFRRKDFRQCDVFRVFSLTGAIPAIIGKLFFRIPYICSYGADYEAIAKIHGRDRRAKRYRMLAHLVFRTADRILCPNAQLAKLLKWRHHYVNVSHHPNWVPTDLFIPKSRGVGVLYVGRLVKEKNLIRLAEACQNIGSSLTCIGDGPLAPALRLLGVTTPGVVPWEQLPQWFHSRSVFAMVSLSEGHPKALAEAMACGMPCVLSDAVTEGMGERCQAEDLSGMETALKRLLFDREYADHLGRESRQYALDHWQEAPLMRQEVTWLHDLARR